MRLKPGDILCDRYQIIDILGEGGFATTYKAFALEKPGKPLRAVKEIVRPKSTEELVLQQAQHLFKKEVEALRLLGQNPQIPEYYESFQSDENGNFYLIQEYVEGHPLSQEISTGTQWTQKNTVALLREILEILTFVHQNNVIHRDLKPSNLIRRQSDGRIVLIDFGAVKEISSLEITESGETKTRTIYTPGYASPEQMHGCPQFCSDIYSAGIIGIQAVTGLRPAMDFLKDSQGDIVWYYSTSYRSRVEVSRQLETVLNQMVRFYFPNRYQSAAEVLSDLNSLVAFFPQQSRRQQSQHKRSKKLRVILPINTAIIAAKNPIASDSNPLPPSKPRLILPDGLSTGETILFTKSQPWLKKRGVKEFADSDSNRALNLFKESWWTECRDPETLVYLNNAFLEASNASYYTIAVALPFERRNPHNSDRIGCQAKDFLCGVAQAQTEVNLGLPNLNDRDFDRQFPGCDFLSSKAINGKGLKVIIADDANDEEEAKQRAVSLVNLPEILAVVGHGNSDMTMHSVDIYDRNNLVLISPGAATADLTDEPREFFFRTQNTSTLLAKQLADYLLDRNQRRAALLYNESSPFCASFKKEYTKYFQDIQGGEIVRIRDFDLSRNNFNSRRAIEEIQAKGEMAIVLVPDAYLRSSLNNALEIIKLSGDALYDSCSSNLMIGAWTLMGPEILEVVSQQPNNLFKKLIFSVGWHHLNSSDRDFPKQVRSLWEIEGNTCMASAYDATRALIKALEMQDQPSRTGMKNILSHPDFIACGATGTIQFNSPHNGDRKNPPSELVHIVECPKEPFGLTFVPLKYPTAAAASLKCK
ncbi:MAG: protein kinase domain-containing protein [Microcoleus sp.]